MNYIGSKNKLLQFISRSITDVVGRDVTSFADIFAGTGIVGGHFKSRGARVIANDLQYYSYVLNKHIIENTKQPDFSNLQSIPSSLQLFGDRVEDVKRYLENLPPVEGFIYNNYTQQGTKNQDIQRLYFWEENAKKCDAIRMQIEQWYQNSSITAKEYYYLLSSLLISTDKVANTASVYGAFLKKLKTSALKPLALGDHNIVEGEPKGKVYNRDANDLIKDIEAEVLYLDPPYNHRQYAANYHLLETIAKYDNPTISGVSGLREYSDQKSDYCTKSRACEAFADLIENARFKYIFLSYNNEGIIPIDYIEKVLKSKGKYSRKEQYHQRYKADNSREYKDNKTIEYLHCVECR